MMKKIVLSVVLGMLAVVAQAADLVVFGNGQLNGKLLTEATIRDQMLVFNGNHALKLKIALPEKDLSKYGALEVVCTPNRAEDAWKITLTEEPAVPNARWSYFSSKNYTFQEAKEQTIILPLEDFAKPRRDAVPNRITTLDFHLNGWGITYKKNFVITIKSIILREGKPAVKGSLTKVNSFPQDTPAKRILYSQGQVAGKIKGAKLNKAGRLVYANKEDLRFSLIPVNKDFSQYDTICYVVTPNRTGDQFLFTLTSNPAGATAWNYLCDNKKTFKTAEKQLLRYEISKLSRNRKPVGSKQVDAIELCFAGWDMPYKKGLEMIVEEVYLEADAQIRQQKLAQAENEKKS